jgi:NADH-quinone oxidoreductase subunit A
MSNYITILIFLIVGVVLGCIVYVIPMLLSKKNNYRSKLTAYECGFNPFEDTRSEFNVKFYIVGILFIIFDLEISFLFPFILCLNSINTISVYSMLFFLLILTVGFIYEWHQGALD